ncbi:hypothetical protein POM88_000001 [Heracleum sosnowskyi]|uniref:DUF6598 domain-containing protein n=1 Tax=Heracleum sosnowskyi TaxID=360622 RepID=A0AAD8N993_9APIA|nr:hypothetical protein POM88_000001 [Heracleum sosnowskyi]
MNLISLQGSVRLAKLYLFPFCFFLPLYYNLPLAFSLAVFICFLIYIQLNLSQAQGLYLAEVFNVIYLGPDEIKPEKQIGTIVVSDVHSSQYLYQVESVDMNRPAIQPRDELILRGPDKESISSEGRLKIEVDLFCGDYKSSICYKWFPVDKELHNSPLEKRILSKDGSGEILVLYALFNNAMEAHLEIELLTSDESAINVHGVVAASTSAILQPAFSSMVFMKKPSSGMNVRHKERIPLSRSVIAVPYESTLFLDFHLLDDDENDIVAGFVEFLAKPGSESKQRFKGAKGEILATVTWMGAA